MIETKTTANIRTTIDLPQELHAKLCAEAEKERRSRHQVMIIAIEKFFETPNGNGKKEKGK